jgi:hypothetical protein
MSETLLGTAWDPMHKPRDTSFFGIGPNDTAQNVTNIKPLPMWARWNLINRTIAPLIFQPDLPEPSGRMGKNSFIGRRPTYHYYKNTFCRRVDQGARNKTANFEVATVVSAAIEG